MESPEEKWHFLNGVKKENVYEKEDVKHIEGYFISIIKHKIGSMFLQDYLLQNSNADLINNIIGKIEGHLTDLMT